MPTITREIHVDAPPDVVRRHLDDPVERRSWLDLDVAATTEPDGAVTFGQVDEDGTSHVRIEVHPDGDGAKVEVTVDLEPAAAPVIADVPGAADVPDVVEAPEARTPLFLAA